MELELDELVPWHRQVHLSRLNLKFEVKHFRVNIKIPRTTTTGNLMLSDHTSIELWSVKLVVEFGLDNSRVQVSKFNLKFRVEVTWITRTHNFLSIWKAYTMIYDIYEIQFIPNSRIIWNIWNPMYYTKFENIPLLLFERIWYPMYTKFKNS